MQLKHLIRLKLLNFEKNKVNEGSTINANSAKEIERLRTITELACKVSGEDVTRTAILHGTSVVVA
jgi:hypothetical protein